MANAKDVSADLNRAETLGATPLHNAAFEGQTLFVIRLIHVGADINARLDNGNTPLHIAAFRGNTVITELLVGHGADINARNNAGDTPLDLAIRHRHDGVARTLLAHHAEASGDDAAPETGDSVLLQKRPPPTDRGLALEPDVDLHPVERRYGQAETTPALPKAPQQPLADRCLIQLASLSSKTSALAHWHRLKERFPEELGNLNPVLQPVAWKNGVLTRVKAGPLERRNAAAICHNLHQKHQDCLIVQ